MITNLTIHNTSNLLAGIVPTVTGWNTQPATDAEITAETVVALTTAGVQTNAAASTLKYDLTASKRLITIVYRGGTVGTSAAIQIEYSDNDVNYYIAGAEAAGVSPRTVVAIGKGRYVKVTFAATAAGNTITPLTIRAYQI